MGDERGIEQQMRVLREARGARSGPALDEMLDEKWREREARLLAAEAEVERLGAEVYEWTERAAKEADRVVDLKAEAQHIIAARDSAEAATAVFDRRLATVEAQRDRLAAALEFYADPDTYFGIGMMGDSPCGPFLDDFENLGGDGDLEDHKPGKRAREALSVLDRETPGGA